MIVDIQQLEQIRYNFTDLGKTLQTLSVKNTDLFAGTLKALKEGFQPLLDTLSTELLKSLSSVSRIQQGVENQASAEKLHAEFFINSSKAMGRLGKITVDINDLSKFQEIFKGDPKDFILRFQQDKKGNITGITSEARKRPSSLLAKEWAGIKKVFSGFMHKTYIPSPGNVGATLLGIIGFGYMEQDRMRKEAGEVTNVLVEAVDSGVKGAVARGTAQVSQLQEKLQKFYGVAKEETQAAAAGFVRNGIGVEEMLKPLDAGIKGVRDNYMTFGLALDKMFDLAGGTSAQRMVGIMADYGKGLDEAKDSLYKMMMAGKESGIGTMQFLKNIETAGNTLKKFGFDIDDVVALSVKLQEGFEKLGLPKQFAGKFAAEGLQNIAGSIASMSQEMMSYMGVQMGLAPEMGAAAAQRFENAIDRIKRKKESGGDLDELMQVAYIQATMSMRQANNDEDSAKWIMKNSGMGMNEQGASSALAIKKLIDSGQKIEARKVMKESADAFKDSYMTEKKKISKFQLELNKVLKGVSEMGQAIMGLILNVGSYLIVTFQALYWRFNDLSIPQLVTWVATGKKPAMGGEAAEHDKKIEAAYKAISKSAKENTDKLASGWGKFSSGLENMTEDLLGPSFKALKQAIDLGGDTSDTEAATAGKASLRGTGSGEERIRTIPVIIEKGGGSVGERKKYGLMSPEDISQVEEEASEYNWVGGSLSLSSQGVDEQGNIMLELVGNCPKCGLKYGNSVENINPFGPVNMVEGGEIGGRFRKQSLRPGAKEGRAHTGVDINAPEGSPIYAPAPGIVTHVGEGKGIGKNITIEHPGQYGGVTTWYGHMKEANVREGEEISAGDLLGSVGTSTGTSKPTSPHLHFEVLKPGRKEERPAASQKNFEQRENPEDWFKQLAGAGLESNMIGENG
jgi:murein DD-endopeptidase MepM/ murein hydrolase activator NlpD